MIVVVDVKTGFIKKVAARANTPAERGTKMSDFSLSLSTTARSRAEIPVVPRAKGSAEDATLAG
jgi:hypothetical protein